MILATNVVLSEAGYNEYTHKAIQKYIKELVTSNEQQGRRGSLREENADRRDIFETAYYTAIAKA